MKGLQILIIEDELPAAKQLIKLINFNNTAHRVLHTIDTVESSVNWIKSNPAPDLILMDIQIADGLSFDIFNQVEVCSKVIFTTAFDQYAIQAFKVNAIDYLLKPIEQEELNKAFLKVSANTPLAPSVDYRQLAKYIQAPTFKPRFLVKTGQHFSYVETAEIAFFRSADGMTQAHTFQQKKYFVEHTLEELATLTDPEQFFRISRSLTIHLKSIQKIHPHLNGRLKLELTPPPPDEVFVSRDRVADFKAWLGG